MKSLAGISCSFFFPFGPDFVDSKGKVLDFFSDEDLISLESLRLWDVDGWLVGRTRSRVVGNLAIGRGMVLDGPALLEGVFSRSTSMRRS
jgi:hypothetical protein